jgi:Tol biopolymer transport system component
VNERDLVAAGMNALVPLRLDRTPAWDDVLARAGLTPHAMRPPRRARRRVMRRLAFVLAAVVATLVIGSAVAAALGHSVFGGLGSWLGGVPGQPAPPAQQRAFTWRNGASYAAFPVHTTLRLLDTQTVRGKSFSLLGFRDGGSLCLRVVPTRAAVPGVNQCVTLRELQRSSAPALVVSTAYYPIRGGRVGAVFGFADDTVRSVRVVHAAGGARIVPVVDNVFLVLNAGPTDPIYDPIVQVSVQQRSGKSVVLPFTTLGALARSTVPSYLRYDTIHLPGPTRQEAALPRAEIRWLDRRETRGRLFTPSLKAYGPNARVVEFGRSVQPDPDDPYRIGLSVMRVDRVQDPFEFTWVKGSASTRPHRVRLRPGTVLLCADELFPLRPTPRFNNCVLNAGSSALFPPGHVLTVLRMYREAFTRVSGLAADGVREVDLYLASGRVIPAALRDNAYTVQAPSTQWPAKLVALDRNRHVLEVDLIDAQKTKAVIAPCPSAQRVRVPPAAAAPYDRIDLATGAVGGRIVLGERTAAVIRALGRPTARRGADFVYGADSLIVHFARSGGASRAVSLEVRDPRASDSRVGRLLRLQPIALQRRIAAAYPELEHVFPYGSEPTLLGCTGTFRSRRRAVEVAFGLDPTRRSRTFVRLSDVRAGGTVAPLLRRRSSTLAFVEGRQGRGFRVDLVRPDGTVKTARPTSDRTIPPTPLWAPDGSAFLVNDNRGIVVVAADGASETRVVGLTSSYDEDVAWSPDSRHIAFRDDNMLFVVDSDGSGGLERLAPYADDGWTWSPDGTRIAYVGVTRSGRKALFVVTASGAHRLRHVAVSIPGIASPSVSRPTWSPDGKRIAFECCSNGYQPQGNWIYLIRPDGRGLTRTRGDIRGWSPDGRLLLASHGFNSLRELFLMRSDGSFVRRLPICANGCGPVAWLPDGKRIVYAEIRRIEVADVDGTRGRVIAVVHSPFVGFAISPDGTTIAYVDGSSPREHNRLLISVDIDGSHRRIVARSSVSRLWSPAWQP